MSMSQATKHPMRSSRRKRIIVLALLVVSCILAWQIKRLCVEYYSPEHDPEQVAARKEEEEEEKERRLDLDELDKSLGSSNEIKHALAPAVNAIVKLGGTCSFKDIPGKSDDYIDCKIDLSQWHGSDKDLKILRAFICMRKYDFLWLKMPPGTTDSTLVYLDDLAKLDELILSSTRITDRGLSHLKNLRHLRRVDFSHTAVSAAGIASLLPRRPYFEATVSGGHVDFEVTVCWGHVVRDQIKLEGPGVDDAALGKFASLMDSFSIELLKTNVTDAGLRELEGMRALSRLTLEGADHGRWVGAYRRVDETRVPES